MVYVESQHAIQISTSLGELLSVNNFLSEDRQGILRHFLRRDGMARYLKRTRIRNLVRDNLLYLRAIVILASNPAYRVQARAFLNKSVDLIDPEDNNDQKKFLSFLKEVLPA